MTENSIIIGQIFRSLYEAIQELELTEQAEMYNAIFGYQFTGEMPKFKNKYLSIMFKSHLPTIDKVIHNQKVKIENGKKGGAPKNNANAKKTVTENKQEQPKTTENNRKQPNAIINKKQDIINNNIINNNIKDIEIVDTHTPTNRQIYELFNEIYKKHTGIDYLFKKKDYILIANLIKKYGVATVIQKIRWLEVGCLNAGVFWFAKDINDFNVGTLNVQWNYILPKLTEKQKKEEEKKKKEEELERRVQEELAKDKLGGKDVTV